MDPSSTISSAHPDVAAVDLRRGHPFFPPPDELARIPRLYATESTPMEDKTIWLHYFAAPSADWWIVELDPVEGLAFGYACLGDPVNAEWGYVSLLELGTLDVPGEPAVDTFRVHRVDSEGRTEHVERFTDKADAYEFFATCDKRRWVGVFRLQEIRPPIVVERDLHWQPRPLRECAIPLKRA